MAIFWGKFKEDLKNVQTTENGDKANSQFFQYYKLRIIPQ
jgi:hypothetical protein